MTAVLDKLAVIENQDLIRIGNTSKAMCNDDHSLPALTQ